MLTIGLRRLRLRVGCAFCEWAMILDRTQSLDWAQPLDRVQPLDRAQPWAGCEGVNEVDQMDEAISVALAAHRYHLGIDLHDDVAQVLFRLGVLARQLSKMVEVRPEHVSVCADINREISEATKCLRQIIAALSPVDNPFAVALFHELEVFEERSGIRVQVQIGEIAVSRGLLDEGLRVIRKGLALLRDVEQTYLVRVAAWSDHGKLILTMETDSIFPKMVSLESVVDETVTVLVCPVQVGTGFARLRVRLSTTSPL